MRFPAPSRGFTLLELLLVLGVISTLALLAAPRLSASLAAGRVETQARTTMALAQRAHARAAAEGRAYLLVLDAEARECYLARRRDPLDPPGDGEDPELDLPEGSPSWADPIPFEEGVELREAERDEELLDLSLPVQIAFAPEGGAEAVRLRFSGPDGADLRVVAINPVLGLARLVEEELP